MSTLVEGVALRHPETGQAVFLPAGSAVPEWAAGLVGKHALADGPTPRKAPRKSTGRTVS